MKTFASWSGGKDSVFSCYKAMQDGNLEVSCLLNMVSENGEYSRSHGLSSGLIRAQADAAGINIVQKAVAGGTYEDRFKETISALKEKGIHTGIFGDIDLQVHRDWVERVCRETGISPVFPLWKMEREDIMREFMDAGFKAVVVAARGDISRSEWIGRNIDGRFLDELRALDEVDLCGEKGEYHSFVYDGPVFNKKIKLSNTAKIRRDNKWFLEISGYEVIDKV